MIARGFCAVISGVGIAALINALVLMLSQWPRVDLGGLVFGIWLVAAAGSVLTAPAWLLFCLIFLPVVTHRARRTVPMDRRVYLSAAFGLGALLIVPVLGWVGLPLLSLAPLFGGIGGVCIAAMWSFFVLDVIEPSPKNPSGAASA